MSDNVVDWCRAIAYMNWAILCIRQNQMEQDKHQTLTIAEEPNLPKTYL